MKYSIYILSNPQGKYYIGQTSDIDARLIRHNEGRSTYTRNKGPWKLIYLEDYESRSEAVVREKQLKKWRRELLDNLIHNN